VTETDLFAPLPPEAFRNPAILLSGDMNQELYAAFRGQLANAPAEGLVSLELSTLGGDPEVARMIGEDIRFRSQVEPQRRFVFLGKAAVYSAGVTLMSFYDRGNRYLTRGTRLLIHERQLDEDLKLAGPLTSAIAPVKAKLAEIEQSIAIQNEGFANLVRGSAVDLQTVIQRAPTNWYLEAQEALDLGLVAAVI
jgi:ATP-dependent protease ClpP protease subunit